MRLPHNPRLLDTHKSLSSATNGPPDFMEGLIAHFPSLGDIHSGGQLRFKTRVKRFRHTPRDAFLGGDKRFRHVGGDR